MSIITHYMKEKWKKSHNKMWVKKMTRLIKKVILIMCGILIVVSLFSLYVGNYIYDYTLNPKAKNNIGEKISKDETNIQKAQQWLENHSQEVILTSYDGLRLHGSLIDNHSDVYVIMVHGYRGDGASIISPIKKMNAHGYNLLIPDLRGHGESEGDYIGMGWDERKDILDWIDFLLDKNKQISIVLYGVSMGGATVMNVAGEKLPSQVKAIIEDCGYTNLWDLVQSHFDLTDFQKSVLFYYTSFVTRLRAGYTINDNQPIKQVSLSRTPILFIHGSKDDFVPYSMLDDLYDAANCEKEKLTIEGAGHANSCAVNSKLYYQSVFRFIEKYTKKSIH